MDTELARRLDRHLAMLYPDHDAQWLRSEVLRAMDLDEAAVSPSPHRNLWDEKDIAVITYGNTVIENRVKPLATLKRLLEGPLAEVISIIHILPFFPYSSDDGFAVQDYFLVNPELGTWEEIRAISGSKKLMADLVINHMSSSGVWFEQFKAGKAPGRDYFLCVDPDTDTSAVVRPRSSPLLVPVDTADGTRHVWCTFSADQVDFDFRHPQVLFAFLRVVRFYLEQGVHLFRLDAVAYLWKKPGTSCIHLQETHEVIKLLRTLIEHKAPEVVIITETNVPNRENLTYFGNGNEAHLIYNFSLPPLLIHTLISGDSRHLKTWLMSMPTLQPGTTYFNFIASHDGIGLRPAEDLLSDDEMTDFIDTMQRAGGLISHRQVGDVVKPYEVNIALYDALKDTVKGGEEHLQIDRFVCAHAIMLSIEGVPAFYVHSLLATENDTAQVEETGHNRSINRHRWSLAAIKRALINGSHHQKVFEALRYLIDLRRMQSAFHPNAIRHVLHLGSAFFGVWRDSLDGKQTIYAIANITAEPQLLRLVDLNLSRNPRWYDLVSGQHFDDSRGEITLSPYQSLWLSNRQGRAGG